VEVLFGVPVDHDRVSVQLLASPSRPATPAPSDGGGAPGAAGGHARSTADGIVAAARFVFDKLEELRGDLARARLEMLKGSALAHVLYLRML
jgi:hypothetical protein